MQIQVRQAAETDMPTLMELLTLKAKFDGDVSDFVATSEQLRKAFFSATPDAYVLLAESERRVIGFATYYRTFSTFVGRPGIWLDDLFVRDEYRSLGAGKDLLASLAQIVREWGGGKIAWTVNVGNDRGIAFYEREGGTIRNDLRCVQLGDAEIERLAAGR
ncbi:GNAT family N-acetyltransferase [Singulisphaera rosea]